jgi:hypothetical protein
MRIDAIMQRLTPVSSKLLVAVKILVAYRCAIAAEGRTGPKAEVVAVRLMVDDGNAREDGCGCECKRIGQDESFRTSIV